MKKILIIEDDTAISLGLKTILEKENFIVLTETDGLEGFNTASKEKIDFIILDINLPNKNGIEICKDLRNQKIKTPILMLTSRKEEIDKVLGFEVGADDYLTKPFSVKELIARINAIFRRTDDDEKDIEEFTFGNIYINFKKQDANINGKDILLSAMEYKILKYFIIHLGEVISRDKLLDEVWGYDSYPTTRTVDNYILSLRKKIEEDPSKPKYLKTIYTAGYKFTT